MPAIKNIATLKKKTGTYTISVPVENDSVNSVQKVEVVIDYSSGQPVPKPATVTLNTVVNEDEDRVFSAEISFSEDAVGQKYEMTATMKGKQGNIDNNLTKEVSVTETRVPTGV